MVVPAVRGFPFRAARPLLLVLAVSCLPILAAPQTPTGSNPSRPERAAAAPADGIATLIRRLEQATAAGDRPAILALGALAISRPSFEDFAFTLTSPPPTRVAMFERDRAPLAGGRAQRLIVEIFSERGMEARLGTWRLDVSPGDAEGDPWHIAAVSRLSVVTGLYRLSLNTAKQYDIHNLTVRAPDLTIEMSSGRAFVAETPDGASAVVLLGPGRMRFTPPDQAERTQVRIFAGDEALVADIDMAFLRFSPAEFESRFDPASLRPRAVDPANLRTASSVFNDYVGRTLQLDLSDISRDRWSLNPSYGDLIAELRTKKFGTLTYARSGGDAEDVTVFDRRRRRNISIYASAAKLAQRGRFYSEDDRADYDVLSYDIDAEFTPERASIEGTAKLRLKMRSDGVSSLTFRLAESLTVRGVYSPEFGRLLHLRVVGQNSLIVNLPAQLVRDTELWLDVVYRGRLPPQSLDREAIDLGQQEVQEGVYIPIEQRFLYSNRSYWYPQSTVTDYATARLRITVPNDFEVVASGDPSGPPAPPPGVVDPSRRRKTYVFDANRPTRYLALVISRFSAVDSRRISASGTDVALYVQSSPRQVSRVRDMGEKVTAVFKFYASLVGEAPYPSFTLAIAESDRPGGHSPPYFAMLNQVVIGTSFVWRNDPVSFENYPTFFLAHEVAHQWWGHAVGWKNYHEQWISEGFAQYFAALYAEKDREGNVLANLLRQMRHTAIEASSQGPIYLGYRLGHIRSDDRVFRAIVYNKSAMVLHMLRRLVGDDAFFAGVRSFYEQWKFQKAGTDDFRRAMEQTSGRDLERFFETWLYGASIPRLKFSYHVTGAEAAVRFEQRAEAVDVPITVTIAYVSGATEDIVIALSDQVTERKLPLKGAVRSITANADNGALVEVER
jgi:peptidase M1-like protein